MKWKKFRIKTVTEAEDIIISALYDVGLLGAQIEDKVPLTAMEKEQMFVDILPEAEEDDGEAYLSFFVEMEEDGSLTLTDTKMQEEEVFRKIEDVLEEVSCFTNIGQGTISIEETEDIDWINNWKQYFHQFFIDDILVVPSWEDAKEEVDENRILRIDPGTAFGTGMHETTQLCIRQLRKSITPKSRILDVGTGSGILSIVSLMSGAKHTVMTDLDICALDAVEQNFSANHIPAEKYTMMIGNIISDRELRDKIGYDCYDIVVANILADVLVELTPVITDHLKTGGIYITSGILNVKEEQVREVIESCKMKVLNVDYQGEWVSITAQKGV